MALAGAQQRAPQQQASRLLWALWCCVAATAPAVADTSLELQAGDAAFGRGEYNAAARHYTNVIDAAGDRKAALLFTKRAAAYLGLHHNGQALRDLDQAIELDPTYTQGFMHRGKLHRQLCQVAAARADFEAVLALRPGHKAATAELEALAALQEHLAALNDRLAAGDTAGARAALSAVYGSASDCLDAELAEARLEFGAGNYEQVVAVTGSMLKSRPGHMEALTLRGRSHFYLGDHELAKRHFGEALKYDPDASDARKAFNKVKDFDRKRKRAEAAAEAGEWQEAVDAYKATLEVDPAHKVANVGLYYGLCRAQRHAGRPQEAVQSCESALHLDPQHREALQERVRALIAAERFDEAQIRAREALEAHRNDGEFHTLYQEAERALKISKRKDYYKVLGVPKDADTRTIKKYYKALARLYHPDKVQSEADKKDSEEKFRGIAEAYEILSDEEKRAAYDRGEDVTGQGAGGGGGGPWGHPGQQQFFFHQGGGHQFHFTF